MTEPQGGFAFWLFLNESCALELGRGQFSITKSPYRSVSKGEVFVLKFKQKKEGTFKMNLFPLSF